MFPIGKNLSSGTKREIAEILNFKHHYFLLNKLTKVNMQLYNNFNFTKYNSYQLVENVDLRFGGSDNRCTLYPFCEICSIIKTNKSELFKKLIPRFFFCNKPCWNVCNEKYCCKKELH